MRNVKKSVTNLLCCRMKRSSKIFAAMVVVFILGNFFFLYPYISNMHRHKKSEIKLQKPVQILSEKLKEDFDKRNEDNVFIDKKRDDSMIIENREDDLIINKIDTNVFDRKVVAIPTAIPSVKTKTTRTVRSEKPTEIKKPVMALLVISCNRPAVKRCLDGIFKYKPKNINIPVIVSQDCGHQPTAEVIKSYGTKVNHILQPDLGDVRNVPPSMGRYMGYYKISRHYKWALGQVFQRETIDSVIIIEDDLDISPDFFDYFLATRPLLDEDPSLFCVSAWNDNGKRDLIDDKANNLLYRSDFFPGLGWLMTRKIWLELGEKWPLGFWDDWIRAPEQRQDRACIRPEISRTRTFGRVGVSLGQFFDQYLQFIKLNDKPYPFLEYDLNHLLKKNYDKQFYEKVYNSNVERVTYNNKHEFETIARRYGIMSDFKAGVPRTAYMGVVTIFKDSKRIFITPNENWSKYEE